MFHVKHYLLFLISDGRYTNSYLNLKKHFSLTHRNVSRETFLKSTLVIITFVLN